MGEIDTKSMESVQASPYLLSDETDQNISSPCKDLEKGEIFELSIILGKTEFEREIYMNECRETKTRIVELESKIKEMDEQLSETRKTREEYFNVIREVKSTQEELLIKEAKVVTAEDAKLEALKQAELMETALNMEKQKTDELQGHVSVINETILSLQVAAMEAVKEKIAVLSEKKAELVLATKFLTDAHRELETIRNHQSGSIQTLEKELVRKTLLMDSLQMELQKANDLHNLAQKATSEAVNDINQLIADMELLVTENSDKGVRINFLEMELNQLKLDYKNANKDVERLNRDVEIANKDRENLSQDVEIANKDVEHLNKDVEIANKDIERLYNDVEIANKDRERLEKDVEIAKKDIEGLNKDVEIANKDVKRLYKDRESLNKDIEIANTDIERLNKDVEIANKEVEIANKDVERLNKDVETLTCKFESIKNELDEISDKESEAQLEIALLKSSKTAAAEAAEERVKLENLAIRLDMQQLESEVKEANEEIKRLREEADKRAETDVPDKNIVVSVEEYKVLVEKANNENKIRETLTDNRYELETLKKDFEITTARIGEFRTRAEQAAFRAEAAEKGKAALEEHLRRLREQKERRKIAHRAFKEASITPKYNYKQDLSLPPKTHQPLGKVLNLKF